MNGDRKKMMRGLRHILPRTLFGRSLLIILLPVLLLQIITTFFFFDRHWSVVTRRLTAAVAGEIATVAEEVEGRMSAAERQDLLSRQSLTLDMKLTFYPGTALPPPQAVSFNPPLADTLRNALADQVNRPFVITVIQGGETLDIKVKVRTGLLDVQLPERRIFTRATYIFLLWMIGSSIVLSAVALLFMRNQIRPIRRLAAAADGFGKGRDLPGFKPEGAAEVRQAASAFMDMRDRIKRQMTQRTEMLAGVSHDLRTPLTRMKLQLALLPADEDSEALKSDVGEMEKMVEGYLAFARGDEFEPPVPSDIAGLVEEVARAIKRAGGLISLTIAARPIIHIGRTAIRRCITNLLENARRYADETHVTIRLSAHNKLDGEIGYVEIIVDDDGPGIPADRRNDVFKPFFRLDASRNANTGGVGLGLTIASDIARRHGGDLVLDDSPMGGLRVTVKLPS